MKNLEEVVIFFVETAMATKVSLADDQKITIKDVPNFYNSARALIPAVKDFKLIKQEWEERTDAKIEAIMINIRAKFDITDDKLEALIEDSCEQAFGTSDIINRWIDIV